MANPFAKFVEQPQSASSVAPQAAPATGVAPEAMSIAPAPAPEQPNPFANAAVTAQPITDAELSAQYKNLLNKGAGAQEIIDWSHEVGRPLDLRDDQLDALKQQIAYRDAARDRGDKKDIEFGNLPTDPTLRNDGMGRNNGNVTAGDMGAAVRKGANTVLMNFGDEIMSGIRAPFQALTSDDEGSYIDRVNRSYRDNWLNYNAQDQVDAAGRGTANNVGLGMGISGALAMPMIGAKLLERAPAAERAAMTMLQRGQHLGRRMAAGSALGAAGGAVNATGEGSPDDRFGKTGEGATMGAVIGGGVPLAVDAVTRVARPIIEHVAPDSAAAFARRLGLNPEEASNLRGRAAEQQELVGPDGVSLIDVLPQTGRDVVGAAARKDGAREAFQDVAEQRGAALPERVRNQADRISDDVRTPDELRRGIEADRDKAVSAAMDPIRNVPIPLDQGVADVLTTQNGLQAIRQTIRNTPDVATQQQLEELYAGLRDLRRSVDPRLPEATQQRLQGVSLANLPFTIDMSDKISREMGKMGESGNSAMFGFKDTVRDAARISPEYRRIMDEYATAGRASDAVGIGTGETSVMDEAGRVTRRRNQGEGFLEERPSRFEQRVDNLSDEAAVGEPVVPAANSPLQNIDEYNHPSGDKYVNAEYMAPDGDPIRVFFKIDPEGRAHSFTVGNKGEGMGSPSDGGWDEVSNTLGPSGVRDMITAVRADFPEITAISGKRVTGASAGTPRAEKTMQLPEFERPPVVTIDGQAAPSERELMAAGAADTVRQATRTPAEAATTARSFNTPDQTRRTEAVVGEQRARTINRAMDAELKRVQRVQEQVASSGGRGAEGAGGVENFANTLYTPGPISFTREALRFMNKIGMRAEDAQWIVSAATDPRQLQSVISKLEQAGLDRVKAQAYADMLRTMAVRGTTNAEEENR